MKDKTKKLIKEWYSLDHITHVDNLGSILEHDLLAHNNPYKKVDISNREVNARRNIPEPIYNKRIHEYVPLYINPRNAMLYRNQAEHRNHIIILGFMPELLLLDKQIVITDGNAVTSGTLFDGDIDFILELDFNDINSPSWTDFDGVRDEELKRKMMSEVLVYKKVDMKYLKAIFCQTEAVKKYIEQNYKHLEDVDIQVFQNMFFWKFL